MSNGLKDGDRKITKIKEDLDKEKALSEKKKKKDLEVMRRMKNAINNGFLCLLVRRKLHSGLISKNSICAA